MSIQTLTQRFETSYPIAKTIAPQNGGHIDFRNYCNNVSEFDSFFSAIGQELRQEGLITFEIETGKLKICKKAGSSWTWEQVPTMNETLSTITEKINEEIAKLGGSQSTADKKYDKHVIICVAGQSNAVGYDESQPDLKFAYKNLDEKRVLQLSTKTATNLQLIPLGSCAENLQKMDEITARGGTNVGSDNKVGNFAVHSPTTKVYGTRGVHLPLANLLLDEIPEDYGIIVIPNAYGGTGFNSGNSGSYNSSTKLPSDGALKWGVNSPYYLAMVDRIKYALDLNEENLFLGVVWIQGENDMSNAAGHKTAWTEMVNDFFEKMNADPKYKYRTKKGTWDKDIWYNVETTYYWYTQGQCQQIWDNYKAWNKKTYVEIPRDTPVNTTFQTSGTNAAHFGQGAYYNVVAPRIYKKMKENNALFRFTIPESTTIINNIIGEVAEKVYIDITPDNFTYIPNPKAYTLSLDETNNLMSSGDPKWESGLVGSSNLLLTDKNATEFMFTATRGLYWIVVAGNEGDECYALGLLQNGSNFGVLSSLGTSLAVRSGGSATIHESNRYLEPGDKVWVIRDDEANTVEIHTQKASEEEYVKLMTYDLNNLPNRECERRLGVVCGISPSNEPKGDFGGSKSILRDGKYYSPQA